MPKNNSRARGREDDLVVEMHEVDPDEVDNEDDELEGRDSNLTDLDDEDDTRVNDRDEDDLDEDQSDEDEDEDEHEDEPPARRQQARQAPAKNPRDVFLKRLKRAERQIAEVRDENAELATSNQRLGAELDKIKKGGDVDKIKKEAEAKLSGVRERLKVAIEAGDSDAQARLTEELADIKADVKKAEALAEASKGAGDASVVTRSTRLATQWKRKHQRFNTDKAFNAFVSAIDRTLPNEGFDSNTDAYWKELDKRVRERFPEEYGKAAPPRARHPASGPEGDSGTNRGGARDARKSKDGNFSKRGKAFVLSASNMRTMRAVGLDPDDAEDRKTFVRENQ